jgi:NitT/TauT family transport system substrate-binding protein
VALNLGSIDASAIADPVWSKNQAQFRVVVRATDVLPPLCNVIGVSTGAAVASRGDFLRAVLRARRKAVEFMQANPDEAGDIVAKVYDLDPAIARQAVRNLTTMAPGANRPYWGTGRFDIKGMDSMIAAQRGVGAYSGTPDWEKMIDRSFLADDLKKDY